MVLAMLSLGGNLEPRQRFMDAMERELSGVFHTLIARSRLMETEPVSVTEEQPWFLNRILLGTYRGAAHDLLYSCREIETKLGRTRPYRNAPRTADIDILLFGANIVSSEDLRIPHPGLSERRFCIEGAKEIAPRFILPDKGITIEEHYDRLPQSIKEQKIKFLSCRDDGAKCADFPVRHAGSS